MTSATRFKSSAFLILLTSALAAYAYCGWAHFCKEGHGAHTMDTRPVIAVEAVWIAGLGAAMSIAWLTRLPGRIPYTVVLLSLFWSRRVLESGRGLLFLIELPLALGVLAFAIRAAAREIQTNRRSPRSDDAG
jgi:hypothetical protein